MVKQGGGKAAAGWVKKDSWKGGGSDDVDAKVRKTIGWYNKQGTLAEPISYRDVAPLLNQLGAGKAGAILASMEDKVGEINNPTAWLASAARKAGATSGGGWGGASGAANSDASKKISKTIGWYNKQGTLAEPIQYNEVAPLLNQLAPGKAGAILASMEEKVGEINNPTAWLASAARKAGATSGGGWSGASSAGNSDAGKKISKTIGWYNKQGNLQEPIQYSEVAPLLESLGPQKAGALLKQLEGKESEIQNPTAWLANAARKAGASSGTWVWVQ